MKEIVLKRLDLIFALPNDELIFEETVGDGRHFSLTITSEIFENLTRIERSKMVYNCLTGLIGDEKIHALKLILKTHAERDSK